MKRKIMLQVMGIMAVCGAATAHEAPPVRLDDVVVTGTRTEKKLSETPVRTELIRRDDITTLAAGTLADAVEFASGVRVDNPCVACGASQIRLLGLDGAYSQILMDGQPLLSSVAAVYGIEQIPARAIERIEIVKGGGSALYGPGAVAGVVNVISREPATSGGEVETSLQDMDGAAIRSVSAFGSSVSPDGRTRFSIHGLLLDQEAYDRNDDGFSDLTERNLTAFGLRLRQWVSDEADLTLHFARTLEDRRGGDRLDLPELQTETAESAQSARDIGGMVWTHAPSDTFDYRLTFSFALTERDSYYGSGGDPNAYGHTKNPVYVLDSQFNHSLGDHTVTWGAQHQREELEDRQPAYDRITDATYDNTGLYVQDDWRLTETVNLVVGGRADKHSALDDVVLSPRLAAKWSPDPEVAFRASYAEGFRAPQVFNEDLHIAQVGGEGQVIRNAPGLSEEKSSSYSLSTEWTPAVGPGFARAGVAAFFIALTDAFAIEERDDPATPDQMEMLRINRGGANVHGAEFNIGYQIPDLLEIDLGYVSQTSRYDDPDSEFGSRDFFRTPDNYAALKFTWNIPSVADLFVGAKYTGPMKVPHYAGFIPNDRLETTDSFLTWDIALSRTLAGVTWTVGVKNLTDEFQADIDRGADRDAGYAYGPRAPRTFHVGAKYAF